MFIKQKTLINSSGFTLIEMLVVMGIFGVVLAGILKVFDTSNYTYKVQEEVAEMQQNVRVSKMFLEKDIRMSGCDLKSFYIYEDEVFPFVFQNGTGDNGSDKLTVNYVDYSENNCNGVLPNLTTNGDMTANAAEAEINEDLSVSPYNVWDNVFTCNGVTYGGSPFINFRAIIKALDGSKSDIVWVTQVQNTGTDNKIQNAPYPNGCPGGCNKIINSYPAGSVLQFFNIRQLKRYTYYISGKALKRDTLDPEDGITVIETDTIATNIEDLQFVFGLDTTNDNLVDTKIGEATPATLSNAQSKQVRLVTIIIQGRTSTEHRGFTNTRPAIENNSAGSVTDGYRRKQLQVTIKVRNLGLQ